MYVKRMTYENSKTLKSASRQLLENQTFLYNENLLLQQNANRLSAQLEHLRATTVSPEIYQQLKQEKDTLVAMKQALKAKIRLLKAPPPPLNNAEIERAEQDNCSLIKSAHDLHRMLEKIGLHANRLEINAPSAKISETFIALHKKIEEEEKKNEEANEIIRKLREDDEKYVLREKITDMKQLLTDLEVENTKLKLESERLAEDVEDYKKDLREAIEESKATAKNNCKLEDEKDKLKLTIADLENDKLRLKKEMIEELNEANRAKRVAVDTELALKHVSEAFENKRKEVAKLSTQLEDAEKIIDGFKKQFNYVK